MVSSMAKTAESVPVKKTAWQKFWKRNRGLLYVLPWLLGFLCFKCYPFFSSFIYSLKDFNLFKGDADFIGLGNYIKIFNTKKYMKAYPETNCQGLFNQIHKKGARSTVWLLTPRLTAYIFPSSRSLQRYA